MVAHRRFWLAVIAMWPATWAVAADRPVVVELFTSEGCSSCPPADAYLTDLVRTRSDVLALGFHVTYWNSLGWRDPFSLEASTARQESYASRRGDRTVFTPDLVIDGNESVVGSNTADGASAIRRAKERSVTAATVRLSRSGQDVVVQVGDGTGRGSVVLVGFDPEHQTAVTRGENRGRTLLESNVVRSVKTVGSWSGAAIRLQIARPAGADAAVLLQSASGQIIGAARLGGAS